MEGMVNKEMVVLQQDFLAVSVGDASIEKWATGLIQRLLEMTHGQWIYRNLVVHDEDSGALVNSKKEVLREKIEEMQAMTGKE